MVKTGLFSKLILYCSNIERYIVQNLNDMKDNEDHFKLLRKVGKKPGSTKRELANELGFSLGKLNYILNELKKKV